MTRMLKFATATLVHKYALGRMLMSIVRICLLAMAVLTLVIGMSNTKLTFQALLVFDSYACVVLGLMALLGFQIKQRAAHALERIGLLPDGSPNMRGDIA